MGIGINFDRDDDYDGPMFGRHWLEDMGDMDNIPMENIFSKENILKSIQKLSKRDREWLEKQMGITDKNILKFKADYLKKTKK